MKINTNELKAVQTLLQAVGQDVKREGLIDTPKRYVKFLKEFCNPPKFNFTMFENEGSNQMIIVKDIPFFSLCEHHLAPFFGNAAIAYIPNDKIVGLSKLPRTLDLFARKPQNQERIGKEVADYLMKKLNPKGVAVMIQARHLCVEMRGVQKHSVQTITSEMRGVFYDDINCRQEFLSLIKNK
jgi:GTP cyclohydrolase I